MTRFALILGLLLCLTVPAAGQKGDLQRQIAEKQRAIDALEKQIARGEQELTSIKKGKNSEQQSVRRLSRQIASRRQLLDETESQLSLLAEQLAASDSTAGALNVRLERYRAQYAAMVREAYRNYKQNSYLTYIFASKDFADVARRIANIRGVAKLREAKLREIAETAQEVGRQQELLAARRAVSRRSTPHAARSTPNGPVTNATSATPRHACNACRRVKRPYCAKRSGRRSSSTRPSPNCRNSPRATRREPRSPRARRT